jgi:hypothetical protein
VRQQTGCWGLQGFMGMVLCETADWMLGPARECKFASYLLLPDLSSALTHTDFSFDKRALGSQFMCMCVFVGRRLTGGVAEVVGTDLLFEQTPGTSLYCVLIQACK